MTMLRSIVTLCLVAGVSAVASAQASLQVKRPDVNGPRKLEQQTATAAIHNYLQAWSSFHSAFQDNDASLLNRDFVGTAKEKLSATIGQQSNLKIHTGYQDRAHVIQIVFYSPEGLSLELTDDVEYDMQLIDQDKPGAMQHMRAHYIVVMTPSETRWKVRVFQAVPE